MPNRIIREGLLDSEAIARAGEPAEVLFTRLLLVADDFGRFDGRLTVICRRCWPNGGPQEESVRERLKALAMHGLVVMYEADGKPYLFVPNFKQRSRATKSKYPPPPVGNLLGSEANLSTGEKTPLEQNPNLLNELQNDGQMSANGQTGGIHPRTYSYSVSDSNSLKGARISAGTSTATPKAAAHSVEKARQAIAESRQASEVATPMPKSIAERYVPKRPKGEADTS